MDSCGGFLFELVCRYVSGPLCSPYRKRANFSYPPFLWITLCVLRGNLKSYPQVKMRENKNQNERLYITEHCIEKLRFR
jgi:hypothetical protein